MVGSRVSAVGLYPISHIGISQAVICFLRDADTDLPREATGPLGSNCFSLEVRTALMGNMLITKNKSFQTLPLAKFSGSGHVLRPCRSGSKHIPDISFSHKWLVHIVVLYIIYSSLIVKNLIFVAYENPLTRLHRCTS